MTPAEYDLALTVLAEHVGYLLTENDPPTTERLKRIERLQALCEMIRDARRAERSAHGDVGLVKRARLLIAVR